MEVTWRVLVLFLKQALKCVFEFPLAASSQLHTCVFTDDVRWLFVWLPGWLFVVLSFLDIYLRLGVYSSIQIIVKWDESRKFSEIIYKMKEHEHTSGCFDKFMGIIKMKIKLFIKKPIQFALHRDFLLLLRFVTSVL